VEYQRGNKTHEPARYYHVTVKNRHYKKLARDCVVFIKDIKELRDDVTELRAIDLVEIKWRGVKSARVTIPPDKERMFDGFFVFENYTRIAYLGYNRAIVDFTVFDVEYSLRAPGTYDLNYLIYAENFSPVNAIFRVQLRDTIDDINFFQLE